MFSTTLQQRFTLFENYAEISVDKQSLSMAKKVLTLLVKALADKNINIEPDVGIIEDGTVEITCPPSFATNHTCCLIDMAENEIFIYTPTFSTHSLNNIENDDEKQAAEIYGFFSSILFKS